MHQNVSFRQLLLALLILALLASCNPLSPKIVVLTPGSSRPGATASAMPHRGVPTQPKLVGTATPVPTSTVQVSAEELDGLKLVFWHPFSGARQKQLMKMVEAFNRQNEWGIQIQLKAWNGWGELDEQARLLPVSKEKPDLMVGYNYQVLRWDSGGYLFVDLDNYVDDTQWGLTAEERQVFYPAIWSQDFVADGMIRGQQVPGGRRLGLPWYQSGLFFFYNATWAGELGFKSPPNNPAELLAQACAAAEVNRKDANRTNDGTGGWLVTSEPGLLAAWIFAYGGEIARPDRKGYQFNTAEARQAVEDLYEFYDSGCAWTDLEVDPHEAFADRKALLVVDSLVNETDFDNALHRAGSQDKWVLLPFYSPAGEPVVDVTGPGLLVSQTTPERQLASWLFVRWMVSAPNQADWSQATGYLPVSTSAVNELKNANISPALHQALPFIAYAHPEPVYASWYTLHWSLVEALDQILVPDLNAQKLAAILESLDKLASEVHSQVR